MYYNICTRNILIWWQVNEGEPAVMWLSGLHIPESYLTALVQATCRKNGWPLDKSTLYTSVTKWSNPDEVTEKAHQGRYSLSKLLNMAYCLTTHCITFVFKQNFNTISFFFLLSNTYWFLFSFTKYIFTILFTNFF
jgi:hypothetical protein